MKNRIQIYKKNNIFYQRNIFLFKENLVDEETSFLSRRITRIAILEMTGKLTFNRSYHFAHISTVFFFIMSILLLNKFWRSEDWRFIFGIILFFSSLLSFTYYLIRGRYIGEIEIEINNNNNLIITAHKETFYKIKNTLKFFSQNGK